MEEMIMFAGDKHILEQIESDLKYQGYSIIKHLPTAVRDGYVGGVVQGAFVLIGGIGIGKIIIEYIRSNKIDIEFTPDGKISTLSCHKRNLDKIITMFTQLRSSLLAQENNNIVSSIAATNCCAKLDSELTYSSISIKGEDNEDF